MLMHFAAKLAILTCHVTLTGYKRFGTSVCEFTFTWLSAYRHQTKHMNRFGFNFFLQEMAWSHNDHIFEQDATVAEAPA